MPAKKQNTEMTVFFFMVGSLILMTEVAEAHPQVDLRATQLT